MLTLKFHELVENYIIVKDLGLSDTTQHQHHCAETHYFQWLGDANVAFHCVEHSDAQAMKPAANTGRIAVCLKGNYRCQVKKKHSR